MNTSQSSELQIIGLTGLPGAGKDTVADILVTHLGFTKLAFADALRREVCEAFGVDIGVLTERATKETPLICLGLDQCKNTEFVKVVKQLTLEGKTLNNDPDSIYTHNSPRHIMQWWGTEYRRAQNSKYWVNLLADRIAYTAQVTNRIVVTDVRQDNEASFLHSLTLDNALPSTKVKIWQVRSRIEIGPINTHSSNAGIQQNHINVSINNDHTVIDLVGPVLLQWLAMESGQTLHTISSSQNFVDGWEYA